ncbi:hypothetical protein, partial [Novosphingobium marinum]
MEQDDPYEVHGIPREIVKRWVNMTLDNGKRHRGWRKEVREEFLTKHGIDLSKQYPITKTGDAILERLPILQEDGSSVAVGWGERQFIESEVLMESMEVLAYDHDVPSLPIHDSLIVPREAEALARETMIESFKARLGGLSVILCARPYRWNGKDHRYGNRQGFTGSAS